MMVKGLLWLLYCCGERELVCMPALHVRKRGHFWLLVNCWSCGRAPPRPRAGEHARKTQRTASGGITLADSKPDHPVRHRWVHRARCVRCVVLGLDLPHARIMYCMVYYACPWAGGLKLPKVHFDLIIANSSTFPSLSVPTHSGTPHRSLV
jgi:hypothetical protein